jgi:squalene-associated FAD-dependent desaturase
MQSQEICTPMGIHIGMYRHYQDFYMIFSYPQKRRKIMDKLNVIIIGGGLSGLSAAVELCARGYRTLVLEQHLHPGGRTYSFIDAATGDSIDNGQHLMMGCYHATRQYMHIIGTEHLTLLQPSLRIGFLHPSKKSLRLACPPLRAPLHLMVGLMRFKGVPLKNRLEMLRVAKQIFHTSLSKEQELDKLNVEEWLIKLGQSDLSRKFLWDVITIGALNNHPKNVSALMLFRVLRAAFLGKREHSSLLLPRAGLSDVLVNPAVEFIRRNGGDVLLGTEVSKVHFEDEKIISVSTKDGKEFRAQVFLNAVRWFEFERLLSNSGIRPELTVKTPSRQLYDPDRFKASPIISIQLWFDRIIMEEEFAALVDTRVQWVFDKSWKFRRHMGSETEKLQKEKGQHLSLVISGAQEFVEMSKEELLTIAMKDLRRVLPKAKDANIVHSVVIKEKRATFSPSPGLEAMRPLPETTFSNLFLAGDWTNTGLPATIEGAVLSGKKAAELICEFKTSH